METIIDFILANGVTIAASAVIAGVTYTLGHARGYIKRKAEDPKKDFWDVVEAVAVEIEAKK